MDVQNLKFQIGKSIKKSRRQNQWTQIRLAKHLKISQPHLSASEKGVSSLTAEQFILYLQTFNLSLNDVIKSTQISRQQMLQNAVQRLGVRQLQADVSVFPSSIISDIHQTIRETIIVAPSAKLLCALCPLMVMHIEDVNFESIAFSLYELGADARFWWVVEGTLWAIRNRLHWHLSEEIKKHYKKTEMILSLRNKPANSFFSTRKNYFSDILAWNITSPKELDKLKRERDALATRWHIITPVKLDDFTEALIKAEEKDLLISP